jgi:hypothetical protein
MDEEPCDCSNVLTYRNDKAIVMQSCEYYTGEKCRKAKADRKATETPEKNWVLSMFQALIFVFICVYLTFVNPL